jgi:hypothetical protein
MQLLWGGAIGLGVNVFGPASVAYSLRIPTGSKYSGPLIRVRRSSDNAEQDFGVATVDSYGNRLLDTSALLTFCGSGSGFVTTWYNQAADLYHMTQTTAASQPRIVNAGAVEASNGLPAVYTTTGLSMAINPAPFLVTGNGPRALSAVLNRQSAGSLAVWSGVLATGAWGIDNNTALLYCPYAGTQNITSAARAAGTPHVFTGIRTAGVSTGYVNGTSIGTNSVAISTVATNGLGIGVRPTDLTVSTGWYSEVVYVSGALSTALRQALERSQGSAFGITVA